MLITNAKQTYVPKCRHNNEYENEIVLYAQVSSKMNLYFEGQCKYNQKSKENIDLADPNYLISFTVEIQDCFLMHSSTMIKKN